MILMDSRAQVCNSLSWGVKRGWEEVVGREKKGENQNWKNSLQEINSKSLLNHKQTLCANLVKKRRCSDRSGLWDGLELPKTRMTVCEQNSILNLSFDQPPFSFQHSSLDYHRTHTLQFPSHRLCRIRRSIEDSHSDSSGFCFISKFIHSNIKFTVWSRECVRERIIYSDLGWLVGGDEITVGVLFELVRFVGSIRLVRFGLKLVWAWVLSQLNFLIKFFFFFNSIQFNQF